MTPLVSLALIALAVFGPWLLHLRDSARQQRELREQFDPGPFGGRVAWENRTRIVYETAAAHADPRWMRPLTRLAFLLAALAGLLLGTNCIPPAARPRGSLLEQGPLAIGLTFGLIANELLFRWRLRRTQREFVRVLEDQGFQPMSGAAVDDPGRPPR